MVIMNPCDHLSSEPHWEMISSNFDDLCCGIETQNSVSPGITANWALALVFKALLCFVAMATLIITTLVCGCHCFLTLMFHKVV